MYPEVLQQLIEAFKILPGVGEKTAERYALSLLDIPDEEIENMASSLTRLKKELHYCKECGNLTDQDTCSICQDTTRDHSTIFVVATTKDILAMEKTGVYHGVYHVLNGLISTSKGILPQNLNIDSLLERSKHAREVILATNTTMDGETTAMYLENLLSTTCPNLTVSRIARGLPTGGLLDYADEMTLSHALEDRKQVKGQ